MRLVLIIMFSLFLTSVSSAVNVTEPDTLDQAGTTYVLQNDIVARGTAFWIGASNVTFDLNGYTITYADTVPGHGIKMSAWGKSGIRITGGTIREGDAIAANDSTNTGYSPISFGSPSTVATQIDSCTLVWHAPQANGILLQWNKDHIIFENTITDSGTVITNRHQQTGAIHLARTTGGCQVYDNDITGRQLGIVLGDSTIAHDNTITILSRATNSFGIGAYNVSHGSIYNNTIDGTGVHPLGIGIVSQSGDWKIYNNTITVKTTLFNPEYGSTHSAAFRSTWGADNVEFYDNTCTCNGEEDLLGSGIDSETWCIWVGLTSSDSSMSIHDNEILAEGNGAEAAGLCVINGADNFNLVFEDNIVTSDWGNVYLSNDYGWSAGFPLFLNNTFKKKSGGAWQATIMEFGFDDYPATGRFYGNTFQGQTDFEDMSFWWSGNGANGAAKAACDWPDSTLGIVDVRKATKITVLVQNNADPPSPLPGFLLEAYENTGRLSFTATTGSDGKAYLYLDEYAITNCDNYAAADITEDYLETDAHKVIFNDWQMDVGNGFTVWGSWDITVLSVDLTYVVTMHSF